MLWTDFAKNLVQLYLPSSFTSFSRRDAQPNLKPYNDIIGGLVKRQEGWKLDGLDVNWLGNDFHRQPAKKTSNDQVNASDERASTKL